MLHTRVHHRFSVDDYEEMIHGGILTENDRTELIRGEIIEKTAIGDLHAACVNRLNRLLIRAVGDQAIVNVQNSIVLADSEPEPDFALLQPREDFYATRKPRPSAVLLVIEVADSTLDFDRAVKRPLYAENGIVEYWILNLADECLEVHRQPQVDRTYRDIRILRRAEQVEVISLPGLTVAVADML